MKKYYKVMLGRRSVFSEEARSGGFIGVDFLDGVNLKDRLSESLREFSKEFIPVWLEQNPGKTKIGAGLACGQLWSVAKNIGIGDIILSPTGRNLYMVGEIVGDYEYHEGQNLQHRRKVRWFTELDRQLMSTPLKNSSGGITTVINLDKYAQELKLLIENPGIQISTSDDTVEDPTVFALEKHLEDFLVHNWKHTELGKKYDIYESDGEITGQQYPSDTGPIDILAVSKNKKEILVVELKKGRASDVVVGQIQRYMGYVKDELLESDQTVRGVIIAFDDDVRIRRSLSVAQNIDFMTYEVKFKLNKS